MIKRLVTAKEERIMPAQFQDVVLWGHSFTDFVEMFALTEQDLQGKILDCCSGPDSFNVELTAQGGKVISYDPLFNLTLDEIKQRIDNTFSEMLAIVEAHKERYLWERISAPQELAKQRKNNIQHFLTDYTKGLAEHRYLNGSLPDLPFEAFEFDLALCSHYLFANSCDQSLEFHINSIKNLAKVAREVRIFPLLDSNGEIPDLVGPVLQSLYQTDHGIEIKAVPYQFQKKGNAMLRVWAQSCEIK